MSPIFIICGRICAGKQWFCDQFLNKKQLTVSKFVRELVSLDKNNPGRVYDASLDERLVDAISHEIGNIWSRSSKPIFIDGIRQLSVLKGFESRFSNIVYVWIECPSEIRKQRYQNRQDIKDLLTFEEYEQKDNELGMEELEDHLKCNSNLLIVNNF